MLALAPKGRQLLDSAAEESAEAYAKIEQAFGKVALAELLDRLEKLQQALD